MTCFSIIPSGENGVGYFAQHRFEEPWSRRRLLRTRHYSYIPQRALYAGARFQVLLLRSEPSPGVALRRAVSDGKSTHSTTTSWGHQEITHGRYICLLFSHTNVNRDTIVWLFLFHVDKVPAKIPEEIPWNYLFPWPRGTFSIRQCLKFPLIMLNHCSPSRHEINLDNFHKGHFRNLLIMEIVNRIPGILIT